jgi:hypothetical protein
VNPLSALFDNSENKQVKLDKNGTYRQSFKLIYPRLKRN